MTDKGFDRRAKDVTVGTPTPNPTCKIFLPKFEISISDKKKKAQRFKIYVYKYQKMTENTRILTK